MDRINTWGAGLHIDFTAEEVEDFLVQNGYSLKKLISRGTVRVITGNDGGGGVESVDVDNMLKEDIVAIHKIDATSDSVISKNTYNYRPDYVFKQVLKQRMLELRKA